MEHSVQTAGATSYVRPLCRLEYECQAFQGFNERPAILRFGFQRLDRCQVGHFAILLTATQVT